METNTIKSVMFGGFDKEDVIQYIERTAKEASDAQRVLREEKEDLQERLDAVLKEKELLQSKVEKLTEDKKRLEAELEAERGSCEELEPLKPEVDRLTAEMDRLNQETEALRPDAEAYARFRERIGAIECESRKRAADLEDATAEKMEETLALFRDQYQNLMNTFESAAAHVTAELRKVEVNLTQLPRTMDKAGNELEELTAFLKCPKEEGKA